MAQLLFLGRLEDIAGAAALQVPLSVPMSLAAVIAQLPPDLAGAVADPRVRVALNGVLCADRDIKLAATDELAFLPPVSGG